MKWYSFLFAVLAILSLIFVGASCSVTSRITSVPSADFGRRIVAPGTQLVDVRTPGEYAEGHIAGALNFDVNSSDFISGVSSTLQKDQPVYVYCRGGVRSKKAAKKLAKKGYTVIDLDNGILGWQSDGNPVVTD